MPENTAPTLSASPGGAPLRLDAGRRHTITISAGSMLVNTLLPAAGAGYYTYGPVDHRYGQAHVVAAITAFASRWAEEHPSWLIGIGDLSRRGGGDTPRHSGHENGLNIDLRPMRSDGRHEPVTIYQAAYSHERTGALAGALRAMREMELILFNDRAITGVKWWAGHDNHLHLQFKAAR